MSLAGCIRKAGKALDKKDADAIQALVDSGVSEVDAVAQHLGAIDTELGTLADRAEAGGATVAFEQPAPQVLYQSPEAQAAAEKNDLGLYSAVEQAVLTMPLPQWRGKKGAPKAYTWVFAASQKPAGSPSFDTAEDAKAWLDENHPTRAGELSLHSGPKDAPQANGKDIWAKIKSSQVKKEEIEWLGLEEFLTAGGGRTSSAQDIQTKFTRQEVANYIRENGVNVQETVAGEESAAEGDITWGEQTTWDDDEAWEYRVEDFMSEFDQGEDIYWFDSMAVRNWLEENIDDVMANYEPSLDADTYAEIAQEVDLTTKISMLENAGYDPAGDMRQSMRDDAEEKAREAAHDEYQEDPIYIKRSQDFDDGTELIIFGNDDQGYDVRTGMNYRDVVRSDIWSEDEAEIQALDYAQENDLVRAEDDEQVARWEDYVMDGYQTNYREIKLTLPDIEGDFHEDAHYPDRNIVAFLRVDDRDLALATEQTGDVVDEKLQAANDMMAFDPALDEVPDTLYIARFNKLYRDMKGDEAVAGVPERWAGFDGEKRQASYMEGHEKRVANIDKKSGDGDKNTYFIDEMQSDWHSAGRKQGYAKGDVDIADLDATIDEYDVDVFDPLVKDVTALYERLSNDDQNAAFEITGEEDGALDLKLDWGFIKSSWGNAFAHPNAVGRTKLIQKFVNTYGDHALQNRVQEHADNIPKYQDLRKQARAEREGVPNAPFKNDAWMQLALKRAVVDAVEQGYEAIAWPNAEVLNSRWSANYDYNPQYNKKMPSIVKKLTKQQPQHLDMNGEPVEHQEEGYWIIPITPELKQRVETEGFTLFQGKKKEPRGSITFAEEEVIIKLGEASDLSTFLHESGHLFLEMEKKFAAAYGVSKDQEALLKWLGVESFDQLTTKQHEQFARGFEKYLAEGKAPSSKLNDAFAAFRSWLTTVYRNLRNLDVALPDDVRGVFDRMLATEAEIEAVTSEPAYDQFFRSQEQAGKTDAQWAAYLKKVAKTKDKAQRTLDEKVLKELTDRRTAEWKAEKEPIVVEETARIAQLPAHLLRKELKTVKFDKAQLREDLGVAAPTSQADRSKLNPDVDSLLVMAAKTGGLDMSVWSAEGVDSAYMKDRSFNSQVFGRPIFKKNTGLTPDDLAARANEEGYGQDADANAIVDLVMQELGGDPVYTPAGVEAAAERELAELELEEGLAPKVEKVSPEVAFINKYSRSEGADPKEYAEKYGYDSVPQMVKAIMEAPTLKDADAAAEKRMIAMHGDMLNDGSIEREARDAVHSDEQAELLLDELKTLKRKTRSPDPINRELLKAQAKRHIKSLKFKEIKPDRFYRAEIRAAKAAMKAKTDAEALELKTQQLVNHYLYKEARDVRQSMETQRRFIRKIQNRKFDVSKIHETYANKMALLANAYDMRKVAERRVSVSSFIEFFNGQVNDPNKDLELAMYDPIIAAAMDSQANDMFDDLYIPTFDELTADDLEGTYQMLLHLRHVGGELSKSRKKVEQQHREDAEASILKHGGKDTKGRKGTHERAADWKRMLSHTFNKLPSLRNLVRKLDGFTEHGEGIMNDLVYAKVEQGFDHKIALSKRVYEDFDAKTQELSEIKIARHDGKEFKLDDGKTITLTTEDRFMLGLYWGTDSSRDAAREGFNLTDNDVMKILSTLSDAQLNMMNTIWEVNESMWPALSAAAIRRYGVAPPKLDATPFEVNGVKLNGGHMRLFYDSTRLQLKEEADQAALAASVMPSKAGSLHARVGSGGAQPKLSIDNITRAMEDSIHFIAFADVGAAIRPIINSNTVREAIEKKHGEGFYRALIDTIGGITTNNKPREFDDTIASFMKLTRKAATYKHLSYSVRNTVQQGTALPLILDEVGLAPFVTAVGEFAVNSDEIITQINAKSPSMESRASFVNRETAEFMRQAIATSKSQKAWAVLIQNGFTPQRMLDAALAYPTWWASYTTAMDAHGNEQLAISNANTTVAETVGSGADLHLGRGFHMSNSEAMKMFTMFGSWFNSVFQRMYKHSKGFNLKDAEIMRLVRTMILAPAATGIMSAAVIMDGPDESDDESMAAWMAKQTYMFLGGTVPILRDLISYYGKGFKPSATYAGGVITPVEFVNQLAKLTDENERARGIYLAFDIAKPLTGVLPAPGSGNLLRLTDYWESFDMGKEGSDFNLYQGLVEGPDRNK